ncbi:MAG: sulfotransferase [Rhizobiaceae bacterium]|nr:sulfotransferase [Rhizobiaceae bacterium]
MHQVDRHLRLPSHLSVRYFSCAMSNIPNNQTNLFCVLTRGRTGSTAICEDLDAHPGLACHQEVFRLGPRHTYTDKADSFLAYREKTSATISDYLAYLVATDPAATRVGFKLLINHFEERKAEALEAEFENRRIPTIFLVRDPQAAGLSSAIAAARGVYNMRNDAKRIEELKQRAAMNVSVDTKMLRDEIMFFAGWQQRWKQHLSSTGIPFMIMRYEDYCADRLGTLNHAFDFLGVKPLEALAENPYLRVTGDNKLDGIENAGDVAAVLAEMDDRFTYAAIID